MSLSYFMKEPTAVLLDSDHAEYIARIVFHSDYSLFSPPISSTRDNNRKEKTNHR